MTESALIDRCRTGDRDAQRQLYEQYAERIYNLALRMLGNRDDAFEITQESFVRAFQQIVSFDRRCGFGTWLYRIATNEALQTLRRRRTERKHLRLVAMNHPAVLEPAADIDRLDVEEALERLSGDARAILLLKYQEGLDYAAIGEVLECAPGTVASRLNRARAALRRILDQSRPVAEETGS